VNHSCDLLNCHIEKWIIDNECRMGLCTSKDISASDELTFHYNLNTIWKPTSPRRAIARLKTVRVWSRSWGNGHFPSSINIGSVILFMFKQPSKNENFMFFFKNIFYYLMFTVSLCISWRFISKFVQSILGLSGSSLACVGALTGLSSQKICRLGNSLGKLRIWKNSKLSSIVM